MDTKYKTLFAALLLGLSGQAEATPVNVDVTLTVDNVYAIYSGNETDIYDFHGSATNTSALQISIPETYNFTVDDGDIIYIAAWSDDATAQGLLAEFNIDGTILTTANSQWEVMATGIDLDIGDPAPTMSELTTQINLANAGSVASGGWVNVTLGNMNDTSWATSGSVHVPTMASTLQWAWYHQPGYAGDTFTPGFDHREYLVFRLKFPITGCCVEDTCINMTPDDCEDAGGIVATELCESTDLVCEPEPELGACCLERDDGFVCMDVTMDECELDGGDWYGVGVNCADVLAECEVEEPELGACCVDRGDGPICVEIEKGPCKESDGEWFGAGSVCVDVLEECLIVEEPELGACCVKDECIESTEDECRDWDGDFFGVGSTCLDIAVTCEDDGGDDAGGDDAGGDDAGGDDAGGEDAGGDDAGGDDGGVPVSVDPSFDDALEPAGPLGCSTVAGNGGDGWGLLGLALLGLARRRRAA